MSIKTISLISSFFFFILLSTFLSFLFVNLSTKYYIEFKKNEIISYGQLIKNTLENLDISIFERNYIFNLMPSLPEYVYFIIFDDKYNIVLYFPYYFEADLDFLKKNKPTKENVIIDSKEYLITYFLPVKIESKFYYLAIEMDLKLIKEFRNSLGKLFIFFLPLYILVSFIFSFLVSSMIQKRLGIIRDFAVKVALGNIRYDSNYPYKDELEDVFRSIRIMKNNLINLINEIQEAKKEIEISKEKLQNILSSIPFTVFLLNPENNEKIFNNHYMLDIEEIKNYIN
ncbi:MAG: sensor histidine kinase, partial [bacterium]